MSDVNFITGASFDPDQTTEISFLDDDLSGPFWQILVLVIGILSMIVIIISVACVMTRGCKENSNPKPYYPDPQSVFTMSARPSSSRPSGFSFESS
ncbi:hypothetical protein PRIPAC_80465 [Pristionchus pacificus]|uniref:Uncharacterized protein n=1 Tax=Pristionchus pacificus TaxID=54126 RepID=A0A2A6CBR9_PRIPA|nr:hypothetical protein PRIPAC_80465 [Pristionchus pacificus]|eukprot:PDM75589.1 hypothetical protein PRIPAC_42766 [Pristionchus pacificus]